MTRPGYDGEWAVSGLELGQARGRWLVSAGGRAGNRVRKRVWAGGYWSAYTTISMLWHRRTGKSHKRGVGTDCAVGCGAGIWDLALAPLADPSQSCRRSCLPLLQLHPGPVSTYKPSTAPAHSLHVSTATSSNGQHSVPGSHPV